MELVEWITVALVVLKLIGIISWGWGIVFLPLMIKYGLILLLLVLAVIVGGS